MLNVELRQMNYHISKQPILENINLNLEPGKIYGLLGRNGAGKTMLLSLIASYRKISGGELTIGGQDPYENEDIMPQVNLFHHASYEGENDRIRKYLEFRKRYYPSFDMEYALTLLAEYKLNLDKTMAELSQGQSAVVEAVMGLATMAPIVLFDEVTNGMDAPSREKFYQHILDAKNKSERIIVLSTHIVSEMDYLFDEIVIIHHGKVLVNASTDEFLESGYEVTGSIEAVNSYTQDKKVLHTRTLGPTKATSVLGHISESDQELLETLNVTYAPVKLQDLFINMTEDETDGESE